MTVTVQYVAFLISFGLITLASRQIGRYFARFRLPLISGFLLTGIVAGPYVLGLLSKDLTASLKFVDEISLAIIAFAAGSELYVKELRGRFRSIISITTLNTVVIPIFGALTFYSLADWIPFMRAMDSGGRLAVSLLAGAILVARSPSSAIAIIDELRAKGPFTQTVLGVTMVTDIVVIVLFAIMTSVADALLTQLPFDLTFVGILDLEFVLDLALGYIVARVLRLILAWHAPAPVKSGAVLLTGYGVFFVATTIRELSHTHLPFEIFVEPLLVCMVGSFLVTNYSPYRAEFIKILQDIGPAIYLIFFTLTGAGLALDVLARTWPIALALFLVRGGAIFLASFSGGVIARDPMRHNLLGWMTYLTQAGVGLGLAREVAVEFPEWGESFATIIISVIVVSQLLGPPLFKWAIHHVGEAHTRGPGAEPDEIRFAIIFGLEWQSLALARLLQANAWTVIVASRSERAVGELTSSNLDIRHIPDLSLSSLQSIGADHADVIVTMLSNDENYQICDLAYDHFGTEGLIVRMNERGDFTRFQKLGATIVEPSTAIVSLLDHFVRAPAATSLLMGLDSEQGVVDVQLRNPTLHGLMLREIRLPLDVLVLSVRRDSSVLISHGYTRLRVGDWITVVGSQDSLEKVTWHFGA